MTTTYAPTWFDDHDPREWRRWAIAAAIVIGIHLAAIGAYLYIHQPDEIGDDTAPVAVDFAPGRDTIDKAEVAPAPEQTQPEETPPPPPPPEPPQAVAIPEPPPPPKVEEQQQPQARVDARLRGGSPRIKETYRSAVAKHLALHVVGYPRNALARDQQGLVQLGFSVDHDGRVHDLRIIRSSGHSELDSAALNMVDKAQPFPALPPGLDQDDNTFDFPLKFEVAH